MLKNSLTLAVYVPINISIKWGYVSVNIVDALRIALYIWRPYEMIDDYNGQ